MKISLYLTPMPSTRVSLEGKTVVVIDVLRFCTSACAALMAGARGVIPTIGPGEAGEMWGKLGSDMAVLAGERDCVKIENFKLGNSPTEFTSDSVGDKFVVMTTSNGTGVFNRCNNAGLVICCALVNISRVADAVAERDRDLIIVCSGHDGGFSIEDTLCGGILIDRLINQRHLPATLNDAGSLALLLYRTSRTAIKQTIQQGEHGRHLIELGFDLDCEIAASIDAMPVLPILKEGQLVTTKESDDD
ncbi:MAG: 2-phosphosulfolactate phosphatase [bacterium]